MSGLWLDIFYPSTILVLEKLRQACKKLEASLGYEVSLILIFTTIRPKKQKVVASRFGGRGYGLQPCISVTILAGVTK